MRTEVVHMPQKTRRGKEYHKIWWGHTEIPPMEVARKRPGNTERGGVTTELDSLNTPATIERAGRHIRGKPPIDWLRWGTHHNPQFPGPIPKVTKGS